ncbi:MAG: PQQ-binding-like beta-propeller repeat protein [Alphaproteobacteria bacterium]|nr:PQQ-binding-like beta-propeller repeat protein [Alphaproteobacteria bacterium]MBL0718236.1 PQQ-binding-like beta-propeller repeat protein [Alphaproteobacteria bacterium]
MKFYNVLVIFLALNLIACTNTTFTPHRGLIVDNNVSIDKKLNSNITINKSNENLLNFKKISLGKRQNSKNILSAKPIIDGSHIFAMDSVGTLFKVNYDTEKIEWKFNTNAKSVFSTYPFMIAGGIAINDSAIFVSSSDGTIFKINKDNKKIFWTSKIDYEIRSNFTVNDKFVFLLSEYDQVILLDQKSGKNIWETRTSRIDNNLILGTIPVFALDKDNFIVSTSSGTLEKITIFDTKAGWVSKIYNQDNSLGIFSIKSIIAEPTYENNFAFVSSIGGETSMIDLESGNKKWSVAVSSKKSPVVEDNYVFILEQNTNSIVVINKKSGKPIYKVNLPENYNSKKQVNYTNPILININNKNEIAVFSNLGDWVRINPVDGSIISIENNFISRNIVWGPIKLDDNRFIIQDDNSDLYIFY